MAKKERSERAKFIKGAAWLAFGGFVSKVLGALYRIPLTNALGGRGIGLYQMIYPVYCLLLTLSATGIPSSLAKLTAERLARGESDRPLFQKAMGLFVVVGLTGSLVVCLLAPLLSSLQGIEGVRGGYYALAPSVLLVSAISVFRGWFQGRGEMRPTALSEIAEQAVKVGLGVWFAYRFRDNVERAVVWLLLAVSLSELAALALTAWLYRRAKKREKCKNEGDRVALNEILRLSLPVTASAICLPLSSLLDSVLAPRLLGRYVADPVATYGLFAGGAMTIINLPVSLCYGFAAASVPAVATAAASDEDGRERRVRRRIWFALGLTVALALPSAIGLYAFASPIVWLIYRSLEREELATLIKLVRALAIGEVFSACVQTLAACLTAQGKPRYAARATFVGVTVKTVLYCAWLRSPKISVYGMAYATNACYLIAFLLDLVYNLKVSRATKTGAKGEESDDYGNRIGRRERGFDEAR